MKANRKPGILARKYENHKARSLRKTMMPRWWLSQAVKRVSAASSLYLAGLVSTLTPSVITGNIQNTSGDAYATNALFAPLSTPLASGIYTIASTATNVVAAANGSFSVTLKQGNYLVTIGNLRRDSFVISVPNDANTYNVNSLITNAITFNYTYSPIYEQVVNKGQADGYVGLIGTTLNPPGLTASNFNLEGTSSLAAHTFLRFDENAAINDATANRVWRFNRFNITSNNVATLGEVTNIALRGAVIASLNGKGPKKSSPGPPDFF